MEYGTFHSSLTNHLEEKKVKQERMYFLSFTMVKNQ